MGFVNPCVSLSLSKKRRQHSFALIFSFLIPLSLLLSSLIFERIEDLSTLCASLWSVLIQLDIWNKVTDSVMTGFFFCHIGNSSLKSLLLSGGWKVKKKSVWGTCVNFWLAKFELFCWLTKRVENFVPRQPYSRKFLRILEIENFQKRKTKMKMKKWIN